MDEIISVVQNLGFPIAAFFAMFYMCNTTIHGNTEAINKIENCLIKINERVK